ncbi:hypothetical protein ACFE04_001642 [Oxalis oulophora]
MAVRLGSTPMAAFQTCLQIWLTTSLLADGLAMAGQAILAGAFAKKYYSKATGAATRVLQMSVILGLGLSLGFRLGMRFGARIFSKDVNVLHIIATTISRRTLDSINSKSVTMRKRKMHSMVRAEMLGQLSNNFEIAWTKLKGEGLEHHEALLIEVTFPSESPASALSCITYGYGGHIILVIESVSAMLNHGRMLRKLVAARPIRLQYDGRMKGIG